MSLTRILFVILAFTMFSCSDGQSGNISSTDSAHASSDTTPVKSHNKTDFTNDSIIAIQFPKDSSSVTVRGRINGIDKPITVNIPIAAAGQLFVLLTPPDTTANVRINQVFMPDGKADGPFGRSFTRKVTQTGNYKVIIGENKMEGEEWKGKFTLAIKVGQ